MATETDNGHKLGLLVLVLAAVGIVAIVAAVAVMAIDEMPAPIPEPGGPCGDLSCMSGYRMDMQTCACVPSGEPPCAGLSCKSGYRMDMQTCDCVPSGGAPKCIGMRCMSGYRMDYSTCTCVEMERCAGITCGEPGQVPDPDEGCACKPAKNATEIPR